MKVQIEIIERGDPFPEELDVRCGESSCKSNAELLMKVRVLGQVWDRWVCTMDADGLELELSKALAST